MVSKTLSMNAFSVVLKPDMSEKEKGPRTTCVPQIADAWLLELDHRHIFTYFNKCISYVFGMMYYLSGAKVLPPDK